MEALYLPEKHMILCQCKSCKERIMSLSEWERHTGSRKKNWKMSVKLKITGEPLITLLDDIPGGNFKSFTPSIKKEELLQLQANSYSPVYAKWTTERCAVCRWVEDWDYNNSAKETGCVLRFLEIMTEKSASRAPTYGHRKSQTA